MQFDSLTFLIDTIVRYIIIIIIILQVYFMEQGNRWYQNQQENEIAIS